MFLAVYALQFHDSYVDLSLFFCVFFFNDTATTEIYTLSLHDALPICYCTPWVPRSSSLMAGRARGQWRKNGAVKGRGKEADRKSTRLNSSHQIISYAVFCLKKKKKDSPHETIIFLYVTIAQLIVIVIP